MRNQTRAHLNVVIVSRIDVVCAVLYTHAMPDLGCRRRTSARIQNQLDFTRTGSFLRTDFCQKNDSCHRTVIYTYTPLCIAPPYVIMFSVISCAVNVCVPFQKLPSKASNGTFCARRTGLVNRLDTFLAGSHRKSFSVQALSQN